LQIDFVGPLWEGPAGEKYVFSVIDSCSTYTWLFACVDQQASTAVSLLLRVIAYCGAFKTLVSDQGSPLIGKIITNFCELLDNKQVKTAAYHPASNSRVEIMHKSLGSLLRTSSKSQSDWVRLLAYIVIAMRSSPIRGLGLRPHEIVFGGARMSLPIDSVYLTSFDLQNPDPVAFMKEVRTGVDFISEITRENI